MHIGLFAVAPADDDDFLAAWADDGTPGATLYRALRDDAEFRFAELGEGGGYEEVRADGPEEAEAGCVLIDPFDVAEAEDEPFLSGWDEAHAELASRRGYLGARLYRATGPAEFRFVGVMRWSSPLMVFRAFSSQPALYQPATPIRNREAPAPRPG